MKKLIKQNWIFIGLLSFLLLWLANEHFAEAKDPDYPTKPISFIIPMGAGGTTDISSRALAEVTAKIIGQPVVPVNKPGGGGTLGAMMVISAKPDGYTLGMIPASVAFVSPFADDSPYKDLSGFRIIMNYGHYIFPWIVRSDAPWKTWREFIEWARKNPRAAKVGITGARSTITQGLAMWQVEKLEHVEFTHVPFKSGSEILHAILGGHINVYASTIDLSTVSYLSEGKIRILVYSDPQKMAGYENIPTLQELYGFSAPNLMATFGPKGLPDYVLRKLDEAFAKAIKDPDFISVMNRMYTPVVYMNRSQVNTYIEERFSKYGEIVKGIKAEEAKQKP
jgi:tripartite-type tricarboxylate transporter receptor subunit TctC